MNLRGLTHAVDIVVATPEDVERYYKESSVVVIAPAMREGRVVHAA